MRASSAFLAFGALFASSANAAPLLDLGVGVGLTLSTLNSCIFSNVLTKTVDPTKVLDLKGNVCLSAAACLAVKTNEIVSQTVVSGLVALPVCKVKTCPATLSLNKDGLCVCIDGSIFSDSTKNSCIPRASCIKTSAVSGSGASAYCKPKTCPKTLTLVRWLQGGHPLVSPPADSALPFVIRRTRMVSASALAVSSFPASRSRPASRCQSATLFYPLFLAECALPRSAALDSSW